MQFGPTTYGLGLLAGALSTLSPCVLPLVPVLVASAANAHRWGPVALGTGLALSFTAVGLLVATAGTSVGIDPDSLRLVGAALLAAFGAVLLVPRLQLAFARATTGLSVAGHELLGRLTIDGLTGQLLVGLVLGIVWSPCVGPTLGAATTLASRGEHIGEIGALMLLFGLGAAVPLVALGSLSRATLLRLRGPLLSAGAHGRQAFGGLLLVLGVLILTGTDQHLESWLLDRTPEWLGALTTRY